MEISKCPNNLIRTRLVTFPRSGHHLLVRGLTEALDHKLVYSEFYETAHNLANCPYVNLEKSHDFTDEPIDPDGNYIVMIRGFELAIESWYNSTDRDVSLETFRNNQKQYFDDFLDKWVRSEINNRLLINYHDFVDNKIKFVSLASRHMGYEPNMVKLSEWELRETVKVRPIATINHNYSSNIPEL